MLSEDLDKKIRDAAQHHHPTYDEKAWSGMKKLLDKHMPEEKEDRRRFFFILFFFLLLGGGAWWLFGKGGSRKENERPVAAVQPASATKNESENGQPVTPISDPNKPVAEEEAAAKDPQASAENNVNTIPVNGTTTVTTRTNPVDRVTGNAANTIKQTRPGSTAKISSKTKRTTPVPLVKTDPLVQDNGKNKDNTKTDLKVAGNNNNDKEKDKETVNNSIADKKPDNTVPATVTPVIAANNKADEVKPTADSKKPEEKKAEEKKSEAKTVAKKEKPAGQKKSFFFLSVSGGPDLSFTGSDKPGKTRLLGGAGVGYTFKERFTLRTGFYTARKIYTSSPEEYYQPDWFRQYYPNLEKVEADCKVYEIPVSLSYNLKRSDKQNIFVSAGISSYLMKRETYKYYYKYWPAGPTINKEHTTYNTNNHYFSVVGLSAGYQRNLSKRVSITAEPYFRIPLKGVGDGKVKLNSGGVLFTLSVKPFGKTEKK